MSARLNEFQSSTKKKKSEKKPKVKAKTNMRTKNGNACYLHSH